MVDEITVLKAQAYDIRVMIENFQNELNQINAQISMKQYEKTLVQKQPEVFTEGINTKKIMENANDELDLSAINRNFEESSKSNMAQ